MSKFRIILIVLLGVTLINGLPASKPTSKTAAESTLKSTSTKLSNRATSPKSKTLANEEKKIVSNEKPNIDIETAEEPMTNERAKKSTATTFCVEIQTSNDPPVVCEQPAQTPIIHHEHHEHHEHIRPNPSEPIVPPSPPPKPTKPELPCFIEQQPPSIAIIQPSKTHITCLKPDQTNVINQPNSGLQPQIPGLPTQNSGLLPQNSGLPPQNSGLPPQNSGLPPPNSGLPPQNSGLSPQFANFLPQFANLQPQYNNLQPATANLPDQQQQQQPLFPPNLPTYQSFIPAQSRPDWFTIIETDQSSSPEYYQHHSLLDGSPNQPSSIIPQTHDLSPLHGHHHNHHLHQLFSHFNDQSQTPSYVPAPVNHDNQNNQQIFSQSDDQSQPSSSYIPTPANHCNHDNHQIFSQSNDQSQPSSYIPVPVNPSAPCPPCSSKILTNLPTRRPVQSNTIIMHTVSKAAKTAAAEDSMSRMRNNEINGNNNAPARESQGPSEKLANLRNMENPEFSGNTGTEESDGNFGNNGAEAMAFPRMGMDVSSSRARNYQPINPMQSNVGGYMTKPSIYEIPMNYENLYRQYVPYSQSQSGYPMNSGPGPYYQQIRHQRQQQSEEKTEGNMENEEKSAASEKSDAMTPSEMLNKMKNRDATRQKTAAKMQTFPRNNNKNRNDDETGIKIHIPASGEPSVEISGSKDKNIVKKLDRSKAMEIGKREIESTSSAKKVD